MTPGDNEKEELDEEEEEDEYDQLTIITMIYYQYYYSITKSQLDQLRNVIRMYGTQTRCEVGSKYEKKYGDDGIIIIIVHFINN